MKKLIFGSLVLSAISSFAQTSQYFGTYESKKRTFSGAFQTAESCKEASGIWTDEQRCEFDSADRIIIKRWQGKTIAAIETLSYAQNFCEFSGLVKVVNKNVLEVVGADEGEEGICRVRLTFKDRTTVSSKTLTPSECFGYCGHGATLELDNAKRVSIEK